VVTISATTTTRTCCGRSRVPASRYPVRREDTSGRWGYRTLRACSEPIRPGTVGAGRRGQTARASVVEIWNRSFMQFNRDAGGKLHPLPSPASIRHGIERLAAVAQGVYTTMTAMVHAVAQRRGHRAGVRMGRRTHDRSMRVVADHLRAITFLMADGVLPSNEGAAMCCADSARAAAPWTLLGIGEPCLHELTAAVVNQMAGVYSESERCCDGLPSEREAKRTVHRHARSRLADLNEMIGNHAGRE